MGNKLYIQENYYKKYFHHLAVKKMEKYNKILENQRRDTKKMNSRFRVSLYN